MSNETFDTANNPRPINAHHIFSRDIFENKRIADAFKELFPESSDNQTTLGLDEKSNRIIVFTNTEMAESVRSTLANNPDAYASLDIGGNRHSGAHPTYTDIIERRILKIIKSGADADIQREQLWNLHQIAKDMMIDGHPPLPQYYR